MTAGGDEAGKPRDSAIPGSTMSTEVRLHAPPVRIVFAGVGGQGSLLASQMVGEAAVAAGWNVVLSEIHGMSQRGGVVVSTVVIGPAHGPLVPDGGADVLVAFEPLEAVRAMRWCSSLTTAVVSRRPVVPPSVSFGAFRYPPVDELLAALRAACGRVVDVDAPAIAEACGLPRAANVVMLGALAAAGVLPLGDADLREAIRTKMPFGAPEANLRAFDAGRAAVPRPPAP
jgi:indolepyruvate ferredoxin oxidoreductase beta subunit